LYALVLYVFCGLG